MQVLPKHARGCNPGGYKLRCLAGLCYRVTAGEQVWAAQIDWDMFRLWLAEQAAI